MSFKHIKFNESQVLRNLEKIGVEKGWIKHEPIVKSASIKDLTPGNNLTENILKLCSSLRDAGMGKYAEEIEGKFLNFKVANSLYETSKETGEDVINFAHKEHGIIDNDLENQLKILNVVRKEPKGKLASSKDVLKSVKVALGDMRSWLVGDSESESESESDSTSTATKSVVEKPASRTDEKIFELQSDSLNKILSILNACLPYLRVDRDEKSSLPAFHDILIGKYLRQELLIKNLINIVNEKNRKQIPLSIQERNNLIVDINTAITLLKYTDKPSDTSYNMTDVSSYNDVAIKLHSCATLLRLIPVDKPVVILKNTKNLVQYMANIVMLIAKATGYIGSPFLTTQQKNWVSSYIKTYSNESNKLSESIKTMESTAPTVNETATTLISINALEEKLKKLIKDCDTSIITNRSKTTGVK